MFLVFILLIKSNYMLNTYTVCNNNYLQFTFNFNLISFMYFKKKYINNDCRFFFKLKTFKYNYICKSLNISNNNLYFFIKNINKTDYKNNINILYNKNFKKQYYINNYKSNFIVNNCFDFKKKI